MDIIFVQSTPPTQGLIAAIIKFLRKKPFIYNLQDIFPDSLLNAGMIKQKKVIWKIGKLIESITYKSADKIVVISEDFKNILIKRGVDENKIEVIYNWVDQNAVIPMQRKDNVLFDKYNLDKSKFYVCYSGNIGYSQNLEMLLDVAVDLVEYSEIHFIIIGDGAFKSEFQRLVEKNNAANELKNRVLKSGSYNEALTICREYVDF
jgi:glycosyltransferase involved in cell wall biosynthesis